MTEKQIRTIIAQVFAANDVEIDADAVKLDFGVRMPGAYARATWGGYVPNLGKFMIGMKSWGPFTTTPVIQFSGGHFERQSARTKRETVAHEACHLFTEDDHGPRWVEAMELAGYEENVTKTHAVLASNRKIRADNRRGRRAA